MNNQRLSEQELTQLHSGPEIYLNETGQEISKFISDQFTLENKKIAFRQIIREIIELNKDTDFNNKAFYELVYSNKILNNTINKYNSKLPKTIVKKSTIHGNGVFASENIPIDTLITFYPVHFIVDSMDGRVFMSTKIQDLKFDVEKCTNYILTGSEKELFKIGGHPDIYENYENGHIINHKSNSNSVFQLINKNNDYNCNIWMIVSCKKIKKGDEITVNYGPRYNFLENPSISS